MMHVNLAAAGLAVFLIHGVFFDNSPEAVCQHMGELLAERDEDETDEVDFERKKARCERKVTRRRLDITESEYDDFASCVLDASTFGQAKRCRFSDR